MLRTLTQKLGVFIKLREMVIFIHFNHPMLEWSRFSGDIFIGKL